MILQRYKKNEKTAYLLLVSLALILTFSSFSFRGTAHSCKQFQPINKADLLKIITKNHPNPKLVSAMIQTESRWDSNAISLKGAIGLMQVLPESGKLYAGYSMDELFCPEKNIIAGCKILKMYQKNSPNLKVALAKYSGGAANYYERVMKKMREA